MKNALYTQQLLYMASVAVIDGAVVKDRDGIAPDKREVDNLIKDIWYLEPDSNNNILIQDTKKRDVRFYTCNERVIKALESALRQFGHEGAVTFITR